MDQGRVESSRFDYLRELMMWGNFTIQKWRVKWLKVISFYQTLSINVDYIATLIFFWSYPSGARKVNQIIVKEILSKDVCSVNKGKTYFHSSNRFVICITFIDLFYLGPTSIYVLTIYFLTSLYTPVGIWLDIAYLCLKSKC